MSGIEKKICYGKECYELRQKNITVLVCPEDGMNLYEVWYGTARLIEVDERRMAEGATYGMPMLFPTPNRVGKGHFVWNERLLQAQMHGFARKSVFQVEEQTCAATAVSLTASLRISEDSPLWNTLYRDSFPFPCKIEVTVTVTQDCLRYHYRMTNTGTQELAYGLGLHPFFNNKDGQAQVYIGAQKVMEMTPDQLPTGILLDASFGQQPMQVDCLDLDHVFTGLTDPAAVFTSQGVQITMRADDAFTHMVIYTPAGRNFFCVEPQTCSTDAHNLFAGGFARESGLLRVKPGETGEGTVSFALERVIDSSHKQD